jgi:hypothetical protein
MFGAVIGPNMLAVLPRFTGLSCLSEQRWPGTGRVVGSILESIAKSRLGVARRLRQVM